VGQNKSGDLKIPALNSLYFYLTSYCNLNCLHCWIAPKYLNNNRAAVEAPLSLLKEAIDQALPLGLKSIKITGGEPFLNKNIFQLIGYASDKKLRIMVETNATLINNRIARFLKEKLVGHVAVSLDGPKPHIHEALRGRRGCFKKTEQGIKHLKRYGLNVQAIMAIYKDNLGYLEETIGLAEDYGVNSFKINCISSIARGNNLKREGMTLGITDYIELNNKIDSEIQPRHKIRIILDIPPAFKKLINIKNEGKCRVKNILGILPDGRISICGIGEILASLVLGDIRQNSLEEIWKNNRVLKIIREDLPARLEGVCGKCIFKGFCLGKCRAEAYYANGNMLNPFSFCAEAFRLGLFPQDRIFKIKEEVYA